MVSQGGGMESQATPLGLPMVEELIEDSFLRSLSRRFFEALEDAAEAVPADLSAVAEELWQVLAERLNWDFRVEELGGSDDEFAPVVVEL
jgi:hypothetical protein